MKGTAFSLVFGSDGMTSRASGGRDVREVLRAVHAGAWRVSPPPLNVTLDEIAAVLPMLFRSGSAGLVWPRLRDRIDPASAPALALGVAYQAQQDANARVARAIVEVVRHVREAGIEPVLVKGWAVSRHYPSPAIRLCGDIDLIVRPDEYGAAEAALRQLGHLGAAVDLQDAPVWQDRRGPSLRDGVQTVVLDDVPVTVPSHEAHLRLLCLHTLIHGASRPLWLCDVALMLETRPAAFDWARCLGDDRRRRGWVLTALRLAHDALGADIAGTPVTDAPESPRWLIPALLRQWEAATTQPLPVGRGIVAHPRLLLPALRERWQNPIRATVTCGLPFNALPRFPIQCAAVLVRGTQFLRHGD